MKKRNLKHNSSGQVLIITSLLVALLLLSTAVYVIETEREVPTVAPSDGNVFPAYEQSMRNTLISALANVTGGGDTGVLTADLNALNEAITSHAYMSILDINYTLLNVLPYQNGFWVSWGADGYGISSACANFVLYSSGTSATSNMEYAVNVTSETKLNGNYQQLDDTSTQVNLTVNLLNEGKPALAQNFTFYYENDTEGWVKADSPTINDFGNGTYTAALIAETNPSSNPLPVSMLCQDQRGIVVGANVTCADIG